MQRQATTQHNTYNGMLATTRIHPQAPTSVAEESYSAYCHIPQSAGHGSGGAHAPGGPAAAAAQPTPQGQGLSQWPGPGAGGGAHHPQPAEEGRGYSITSTAHMQRQATTQHNTYNGMLATTRIHPQAPTSVAEDSANGHMPQSAGPHPGPGAGPGAGPHPSLLHALPYAASCVRLGAMRGR